MNEWSTGAIYDEVTFSREATPEDYAPFAKLFPEPRIKKPMACLAPVDTRAHITKVEAWAPKEEILR